MYVTLWKERELALESVTYQTLNVLLGGPERLSGLVIGDSKAYLQRI